MAMLHTYMYILGIGPVDRVTWLTFTLVYCNQLAGLHLESFPRGGAENRFSKKKIFLGGGGAMHLANLMHSNLDGVSRG